MIVILLSDILIVNQIKEYKTITVALIKSYEHNFTLNYRCFVPYLSLCFTCYGNIPISILCMLL